jgi:hypothetical protein
MNCQNCLWTIPKGITYTEELLAFQKTLPFIFLLKKKTIIFVCTYFYSELRLQIFYSLFYSR